MAFDVSRTNIEITATDKTKVAFDSIKSSIGNLASQFGGLTGLLGAGAFVAFTKRIIDQADGFNDLSKRTGIAVEQIGAWRLATEQSGTSMDALTAALGKGSKYLVQHGDDLKKIGINAKTSEELILQLSGIISQMPSDDPRRTALAMQVLGKSAGELIPLLSEGEQGLRKMLERGRELSPVTAEMAKNADLFNDNLAEMKLISSGLFVDLVGKILPSLNTYLQQLKLVVDEGDWIEKLAFFSLGYVPGKIADKTEKPEVQIQKYTQRIIELKKELTEFSGGKFGYRKDGILAQISEAEAGLAGQRTRLPFKVPKHSSDGGAPKRDAIAERIKALGIENNLLAQGVPLEDARTIARLKGDGATDQQIVKMLNATAVQNQYEAAEKSAEKTKQDLIKSTEDHAQVMQKMLETADEAVISAQRDTAESQRNLQVMQLGEPAVIRMEAARLNEAAASAEQGLAYAKLNGLSQENIDFTEIQILRLRELAKARIGLADSSDATAAFEKEKDRIKDLEKEQKDRIKDLEKEQKDRIKDLEKEQKDAAKRVADEQKRFYEDLGQALTDGLFKGFKKGESFAKSFGKNLMAFAKTWVLQPTIKAIFSPISGAGAAGGLASLFSGSASASTGGAGGISSLFSGGSGSSGLLSSLFQGSGAQFAALDGIVQSFSNTIGNAGFPKLASALFQNSSAISSALPFAGAAFNLLRGDIKGAAISGLSTAIGSFTPLGPIGGAIIGQVLGGLFGGGKKSYPNAISYGSYSNGNYTAGSASTFARGKLDTGAVAGLGNVNTIFAQRIGALLNAYGLSDSVSFYNQVKAGKNLEAAFSANLGAGGYVGIDRFGPKNLGATSEAAMQAFVDQILGEGIAKAIASSKLNAGIKKFFNGITDQAQIVDAINTLISLKTSLLDLPPIFDAIRNAIDTTAYQTSIADLKTRFAAIGTYTSLFYSEQENFDTFTKQLVTQLSALNTPLLESRDKFRALVDGIRVIDEASSNQFNGLVALAPAMDAYFKQLEKQKNALDALVSTEALRDESFFKNLFDYNFYKGVADNYGTNFANKFQDGYTPTYGASNNTSVNYPFAVTPSNNTTVSTSDQNMLNAMSTLIALVDALQVALNATQANTKLAAQILVNVSPDGESIQTVAAP